MRLHCDYGLFVFFCSRAYLSIPPAALRRTAAELHRRANSALATFRLLSLVDLQSADESHQQPQAELQQDSEHSVQSGEESLGETRQSRSNVSHSLRTFGSIAASFGCLVWRTTCSPSTTCPALPRSRRRTRSSKRWKARRCREENERNPVVSRLLFPKNKKRTREQTRTRTLFSAYLSAMHTHTHTRKRERERERAEV